MRSLPALPVQPLAKWGASPPLDEPQDTHDSLCPVNSLAVILGLGTGSLSASMADS